MRCFVCCSQRLHSHALYNFFHLNASFVLVLPFATTFAFILEVWLRNENSHPTFMLYISTWVSQLPNITVCRHDRMMLLILFRRIYYGFVQCLIWTSIYWYVASFALNFKVNRKYNKSCSLTFQVFLFDYVHMHTNHAYYVHLYRNIVHSLLWKWMKTCYSNWSLMKWKIHRLRFFFIQTWNWKGIHSSSLASSHKLL